MRGTINWWGVHKGLWDKSQGSVTPADVGTFTLPEIALALADTKETTPTGHPNLDPMVAQAAQHAWFAMTPLERIRAYER